MTELTVTTCEMDVRKQSGQAFVTDFIPFGESSCQIILTPLNIRPVDACQKWILGRFVNKLLTSLLLLPILHF